MAIQNFVENITMLLRLSVFVGLAKAGLSAVVASGLFSGLIVILMIGLRLYGQYRLKRMQH